VTSVLRMSSCQRILAIWRWHFIWNASTRLVSAVDSVHVSQAYVRTGRTSVWNTRTLVDKDRYRSLQIGGKWMEGNLRRTWNRVTDWLRPAGPVDIQCIEPIRYDTIDA